MAGQGDRQSADLWRASSLGIELLAAILAGLAVGYGVDYLLGSKPWGVSIGVVLGFAAGLVRLVMFAQSVNKQSANKQVERKDQSE